PRATAFRPRARPSPSPSRSTSHPTSITRRCRSGRRFRVTATKIDATGGILRSIRGMRWFWVLFLVVFVGCAPRGPISPNAVELNRTGAYALAHGDLETAQARFELAIEYHPLFVEAWINLGLVELARGDLVGAEQRFRRAIAINKD